MPDRPRIPLPFGGGIDRSTGSMVVQPANMRDIRNVILHVGRAVVRPGFSHQLTFFDPSGAECSHVLAGAAKRDERVGIVVCYQEESGSVYVYRVNAQATEAHLLGEWFTVPPGTPPPIVHMAEVRGRMFMAHDHPLTIERAATFVYDPITPQDGIFRPLLADLDGEGPAEVRFRGLVRYLAYLVGWGYGTASEDRPELVRVSLPGEPLVFDPEHYQPFGDRRDPVLRCIPGARNLVVLKETELHRLEGTDRATFGGFPLDATSGLLAPRLAVEVHGDVFFWSHDGPKVTNGSSPAEDTEIPLDIYGPEAEGLVEEGEAEFAFAFYIPGERIVCFVFNRRVYVLSTKDPREPWKWSYFELEFDTMAAFRLLAPPPGGVGEIPTGYPEWEDEDPAGDYVDIDIRNHGQIGSEFIEVWIRESPDGAWILKPSQPTAVSLQETQTVRASGIEEGKSYDGAIRYRRDGQFAPAYQNPNPITWPAVSRGSFSTLFNPPGIGFKFGGNDNLFAQEMQHESNIFPTPEGWLATWERLDASNVVLRFLVRPFYPGENINVYHNDDLIETISDSRINEEEFYVEVENPTAEQYHNFRVAHVIADVVGPKSANLRLWCGPFPELGKHVGESHPFVGLSPFFPDPPTYWEVFVSAHHLYWKEAWDDYTLFGDSRETFPETLQAFVEPGEPEPPAIFAGSTIRSRDLSALEAEGVIQLGIRYRSVAFSIHDFSDYVVMTVQL